MHLLTEKNDKIVTVTLNRPPLNVLDRATLLELRKVLDSLGRDTTVNFLVLRGGGERAFSAGVDIRDHTRDKVPEMLEVVHGVIRTLFELPQITIALVRGACLGGGCELASSCDLIVASEDSFFATPEIDVGCFPPVALARFPSQIGYHRATQMILTGERVSAQEALSMGLINRLAPAQELDRVLGDLLAQLQGKSSAVLRVTLKGLRETALKDLSHLLKRSEELYLKELLQTEDVEEGVQAFLEKRKPRWSHR